MLLKINFPKSPNFELSALLHGPGKWEDRNRVSDGMEFIQSHPTLNMILIRIRPTGLSDIIIFGTRTISRDGISLRGMIF